MNIFQRIRRRPFLCILLTLLLAIISGCRPKTEIDQSFLTDLPCIAPCWYDLKLNKSTKADVLTTLYQLPFVDKGSIHEYGTRWDADDNAIEIYYECVDPRGGCGSLTLSEDQLKTIWMSVNYPLTFKDAVKKLGKPGYLEYGVCNLGVPSCRVNLSWPEQSIIVGADLEKTKFCDDIRAGQTIPSETQVTDIFYTVEESFKLETGSCLHRLSWPGFSEP